MRSRVCVRVPATTANLGPGFDCLALALDLWNETEFSVSGAGIVVSVEGEGAGSLASGADNLIAQTAFHFWQQRGISAPQGLRIVCRNHIPTGSGLGSSATAVIAGLMGAAALADVALSKEELLRLATEIEGHPDNAAAAVYGGLVIVTATGSGSYLTHPVPMAGWQVALATPAFDLPTHTARQALPKSIPMADAIFNLGRTALVVEALRSGEDALLKESMQDRLHQPYRLPLIPGSADAVQAACEAGAIAAGLSGAGPSVIGFCKRDPRPVADAMVAAFGKAGLTARGFVVKPTLECASVMAE